MCQQKYKFPHSDLQFHLLTQLCLPESFQCTHFGLVKNLTQHQFIITVERKFNKQRTVLHQALNKYDVVVQAYLFKLVHSANCCLTTQVRSSEGTVTSKLLIWIKRSSPPWWSVNRLNGSIYWKTEVQNKCQWINWVWKAATTWNHVLGPQSACLRQSKKIQNAHMERQLHLPIASVFVNLNTFNLQTTKKGGEKKGSNLVLEIFILQSCWFEWKLVKQGNGTVTSPHTFSQCDVDSGSSALSSSAWRRRWPVPSLGSTGQDSDAPSLESQIVEA